VRLPEFASGSHSQDFAVAAGQSLKLIVPLNSAASASASFVFGNQAGSGTARYQVKAPDGRVLASGSIGFLTQDSFAVDASGDYSFVLDNSANANSRTIRFSLDVKAR
jgi:hypothetical protein